MQGLPISWAFQGETPAGSRCWTPTTRSFSPFILIVVAFFLGKSEVNASLIPFRYFGKAKVKNMTTDLKIPSCMRVRPSS